MISITCLKLTKAAYHPYILAQDFQPGAPSLCLK